MPQVPLGYKGTIIGIQSMVDPNPVRQECLRKTDMFYDILFDQSFDDGSSIDGVVEKRIFKVSQTHLINITYGIGMFLIKLNFNYVKLIYKFNFSQIY